MLNLRFSGLTAMTEPWTQPPVALRHHQPMRLLILGGTWFVGRAIVETAHADGHAVTIFNRGVTGIDLPPGVDVLHGMREDPEALHDLTARGRWDVVIDAPGVIPAVVRDAARALKSVADRYLFMSTVSVYNQWPAEPVSETSALHHGDPDARPESWRWGTGVYGPLKVGAEQAVMREFGADRTVIIRPGAVVGRYEYSGRLPWWLSRAKRNGRMLVPGPASGIIRPLDVRDLAAFVVRLIEHGTVGVFNAAGPPSTFADLISASVAATGSNGKPIWVDGDWLVAQGVKQWTELPLWRTAAGTWSIDTTRAESVGLACRSLTDTSMDTWAWLSAGGRPVAHDRQALHGLSPEREADLLAAWDKINDRQAEPSDPSESASQQ